MNTVKSHREPNKWHSAEKPQARKVKSIKRGDTATAKSPGQWNYQIETLTVNYTSALLCPIAAVPGEMKSKCLNSGHEHVGIKLMLK